jgi:hypothetical protein
VSDSLCRVVAVVGPLDHEVARAPVAVVGADLLADLGAAIGDELGAVVVLADDLDVDQGRVELGVVDVVGHHVEQRLRRNGGGAGVVEVKCP